MHSLLFYVFNKNKNIILLSIYLFMKALFISSFRLKNLNLNLQPQNLLHHLLCFM